MQYLIELELLIFYSSTDILGVLGKGICGTIPMSYFDDSLISFARLELSDDRVQSVPEPSLMLGFLTLGAIGFVSKKRN
jgi:PEP-CTERM motif